jgi:hypothetical protein
MAFTKATKKRAKLRMALIGPSGSGKTYTALKVAQYLVPGGRVAVIDTERGSASKYADQFEFDVLELETFHPERYIRGIAEAQQAGYDVLIIDSLSHAWMGKDGALELVDKAAKRTQGNNSFAAWRDVTPLQNALVDAIIGANLHIIATLRSKMEHAIDRDERGKTTVRKVGLAAIQRDGLEYEFDVVADMAIEGNTLTVSKTRCPALHEAVISKPGREIADTLRAWLTDGAAVEETPSSPTAIGPTPVSTPTPQEPPSQPNSREEQQVSEQTTTNGNGTAITQKVVRPPAIRTRKFFELGAELIKTHPHYAQKGQFNGPHATKALALCDWTEDITDDNVERAIEELRKRAALKEAA